MKSNNNKKRKQRAALVPMLALILTLCPIHAIKADRPVLPFPESFEEDREFLSKVIEKTAPDASYVARLAIAALILNRVDDDRFPSSIRSVVFQKGEFQCAKDPELLSVKPSYLSSIAARDALLGFDSTGGALYFRRGKASERSGSCLYHSGFIFYKEREDIPQKLR